MQLLFRREHHDIEQTCASRSCESNASYIFCTIIHIAAMHVADLDTGYRVHFYVFDTCKYAMCGKLFNVKFTSREIVEILMKMATIFSHLNDSVMQTHCITNENHRSYYVTHLMFMCTTMLLFELIIDCIVGIFKRYINHIPCDNEFKAFISDTTIVHEIQTQVEIDNCIEHSHNTTSIDINYNATIIDFRCTIISDPACVRPTMMINMIIIIWMYVVLRDTSFTEHVLLDLPLRVGAYLPQSIPWHSCGSYIDCFKDILAYALVVADQVTLVIDIELEPIFTSMMLNGLYHISRD